MLLEKTWEKLFFIISLLFLCGSANCYILLYGRENTLTLIWYVLPFVLVGNLLPLVVSTAFPSHRLSVLCHGVRCLTLFVVSTVMTAVFQAGVVILAAIYDWNLLWYSLLFCFVCQLILFWNGIICVYCTSLRLGVTTRIVCAICGLIPAVNIIALCVIWHKTRTECVDEAARYQRELQRKDDRICATKYPILLVHGVFGRDSHFFSYWGRIPDTLTQNGATVYFGNHPSAVSIAESAEILAKRIREIVEETGCEKVNIIGHSKGGLDCRYALLHNGIAPYVASLTTVSSPHKGCRFADYLLNHAPEGLKRRVSHSYNKALNKLGEHNADFMAAVSDLTATRCHEIFDGTSMPEGIFYRSIGSRLRNSTGGGFPMNFTHLIAKRFDGPGDGLVGVDSFPFGETFTLLTPTSRRGISHLDMTDMNMIDLPGFDVREYYVQLAVGLKERGL